MRLELGLYEVSRETLRVEVKVPADVFNAVERGNSVASGNCIERNQEQYIIRGMGQARVIQDLENTLIRAVDNVPIYVRDVAVAVLVFLATLSIVPFMGGEFVPELDEGNLLIELKRLPSITLAESYRRWLPKKDPHK